MYEGFNLVLPESKYEGYLQEGKVLHLTQKKQIKGTLDTFIDEKGNLIASKMQANWFPTIEAQVFISHSHKDSEAAICFSGWLNKEFGLVSFIDSCVWGYADNLLKLIDDKYCFDANSNTYNYKKRNRSTSHVHMMLSTALSKMMDKTECVFFLNTPSSITPEGLNNSNGTTDSPWVYSEIAMTRLVRRRKPKEHRKVLFTKQAMAKALDESLRVKYGINLDHLTSLTEHDLQIWKYQYGINKSNYESPLDALYTLQGLAIS